MSNILIVPNTAVYSNHLGYLLQLTNILIIWIYWYYTNTLEWICSPPTWMRLPTFSSDPHDISTNSATWDLKIYLFKATLWPEMIFKQKIEEDWLCTAATTLKKKNKCAIISSSTSTATPAAESRVIVHRLRTVLPQIGNRKRLQLRCLRFQWIRSLRRKICLPRYVSLDAAT